MIGPRPGMISDDSTLFLGTDTITTSIRMFRLFSSHIQLTFKFKPQGSNHTRIPIQAESSMF